MALTWSNWNLDEELEQKFPSSLHNQAACQGCISRYARRLSQRSNLKSESMAAPACCPPKFAEPGLTKCVDDVDGSAVLDR